MAAHSSQSLMKWSLIHSGHSDMLTQGPAEVVVAPIVSLRH